MKRWRAFTLVEMLLVLSILLASLAWSMPSLRDMQARIALRSAALDLFEAVRLTRSLALARNGMVILEAEGSGWQAGWKIRGPDGQIWSRRAALAPGTEAEDAMSANTIPPYIAYNGAGRACSRSNPLAARWGSVRLRLRDHERRIIINMLGRPRLCDPSQPGSACGA